MGNATSSAARRYRQRGERAWGRLRRSRECALSGRRGVQQCRVQRRRSGRVHGRGAL